MSGAVEGGAAGTAVIEKMQNFERDDDATAGGDNTPASKSQNIISGIERRSRVNQVSRIENPAADGMGPPGTRTVVLFDVPKVAVPVLEGTEPVSQLPG